MHHWHFQFRTEDDFKMERCWRSQEPNAVEGRTNKTEVAVIVVAIVIIFTTTTTTTIIVIAFDEVERKPDFGL